MALTQTTKEFLYIGTYSVRDSKGIYVFEFDRTNETLTLIQTVSVLKNPSFLDLHPSGKFLYAVSELEDGATIGSFSIDSKTGHLTFINQQSTKEAGACHIAIDQTGKVAVVSNYGGGSLAIFTIHKDGSLASTSDVIHHKGSGVNKERQDKSHVHSAFFSPDNKFLIVSDLGTNMIYSYQVNENHGKTKATLASSLSVAPGAGPRHIVFHPKGKYIYAAEELSSSVGILAYDGRSGSIRIVKDTVRSLPANFNGVNTSADIHTDPRGKFLYLSNRGLDAISIFDIKDNGSIELIGQQTTLGKTPRNFFIDTKGEFAFVANQNSDNVVILKIDEKTGGMNYTGNEVKVPSPICIKMLSK